MIVPSDSRKVSRKGAKLQRKARSGKLTTLGFYVDGLFPSWYPFVLDELRWFARIAVNSHVNGNTQSTTLIPNSALIGFERVEISIPTQ